MKNHLFFHPFQWHFSYLLKFRQNVRTRSNISILMSSTEDAIFRFLIRLPGNEFEFEKHSDKRRLRFSFRNESPKKNRRPRQKDRRLAHFIFAFNFSKAHLSYGNVNPRLWIYEKRKPGKGIFPIWKCWEIDMDKIGTDFWPNRGRDVILCSNLCRKNRACVPK